MNFSYGADISQQLCELRFNISEINPKTFLLIYGIENAAISTEHVNLPISSKIIRKSNVVRK